MFICGYNNCKQLGEESDNQSTWGDGIICPPTKSHFNLSTLLSFSIYFDHTVIVNLNGKAYAIGNNKEGQISPTLPKQVLNKETEIQIQDINGQPFKFISAVCGDNYTLYQVTNETNNNTSTKLIFVKKNQNAIFVNINGRTPISLFGGHSTSASIDSEGGVIIITERILSSNNGKAVVKFLPSNEKAVQIACCENFVAVLGISGRLFISPVANGGEMINFKEVEELSGKKIVCVSGKYMHCIAVCSDGKVFGRGSNSNSRLGINKDESLKFIEIKSMMNKKCKIVAAEAGFGHSLFKTADGKIFACGSNFYGHLLLKKTNKNAVFPPVETLSLCSDPFCIAGYCISAVLQKSDLPPNTPNIRCEIKEPVIKERKSESDIIEMKANKPDNQETTVKERRASKHEKHKRHSRHSHKIEKSASMPDELLNDQHYEKTKKNRRLGKSKSHKINTITSGDNENEKSDTITSGENTKTDTLTYDTQDGENNEKQENDNNKFKLRESPEKTDTKNVLKRASKSNKIIFRKTASFNSDGENEINTYDDQMNISLGSLSDDGDNQENINIKPNESPEKNDLKNKQKQESKNERKSIRNSKSIFDSDEENDINKNENQMNISSSSNSEDKEKPENEKNTFKIRAAPIISNNFENSNDKINLRNSKMSFDSDDDSDINSNEDQKNSSSSSDKENQENEKNTIKIRVSPMKNDIENIEKRSSQNEKNNPRTSKLIFNSDENSSLKTVDIQLEKDENSESEKDEKQENEKNTFKIRASPLKNDTENIEKRSSKNEKNSPRNSKVIFNSDNINENMKNELQASKTEILELKSMLEKKDEEISKLVKEKEHFLRKEKAYKNKITELEKALKKQQKAESKSKKDEHSKNSTNSDDSDTPIDEDEDDDENEKNRSRKGSNLGDSMDKTLHQIRQIGKGPVSEVFEVYRGDKKNIHLAQKVLRCSKSSIEKSSMKHFIHDCETLNGFNCPNVVKVFKISIGDSNRPPSIFYELCLCNLKEKLKELNQNEKENVIVDISNGMKEIHRAKILHLDLRLENILFDEENRAKVSDFGICKLMKIEPNSTKFMAPELILKKNNYDEKADVFSFGVLAYVIISGGNFPKIEAEDVGKGKKAVIPSNFTEFSRHLISRCWAFNPSDRPSFEEICSLLDENKNKLI